MISSRQASHSSTISVCHLPCHEIYRADDQTRSITTLEVSEEAITLHSAKTNSTINGTITTILEFPKLQKRVFNPEQPISYSTVVEPFVRSVVNPVKKPNKLQEPFLPNQHQVHHHQILLRHMRVID